MHVKNNKDSLLLPINDYSKDLSQCKWIGWKWMWEIEMNNDGGICMEIRMGKKYFIQSKRSE